MPVNFILESPISSSDARRRWLPRETSKLVIYFDAVPSGSKEPKEMHYFYNLLNRLQNNHRKLYTQPIGSYVHLDKYVPQLKEHEIRYWFDEPYIQGRKRKPGLLTAECDTEQKLIAVFRMFRSDGIVFFLAEDYQPGGKLEKHLLARSNWKVSLFELRSGGYEEDYLKTMDNFPLFVFYEDTKSSLDLLGRRDEIIRAFSTALAIEKEVSPARESA